VSVETLEIRAKSGDVDALLELGVHYEAENKVQAARGCFATAAKAGSVAGLRKLAVSLLSQEPIEGETGVNMMRAAADKGDADAARICANLAAADINLSDRANVVWRCLETAAERGSTFAREQMGFLQSSTQDIDALLLPRHDVFSSPRISVIEGFATPAECDWVMERARPRLHRAHVYNPSNGGFATENARTNSSVEFGIAEADVVIMGLRLRIQMTCGLDRLETPSVLHYAPGQEFKPHCDFLEPATPSYALDIKKSGQRAATFLIYLNDGYEGGETEFLKLDWRYKGRKGDALLFWNLNAAGAPDRDTMHAGLPTTAGEKWVFSQWLRESRISNGV
jgi:prolyl 4-hydroxylase